MEPSPPTPARLPEPLLAQRSAAKISAPAPLLVGLRAARANLVPGLCLQALMLAVVFAYYRIGPARPWFDRLGELKHAAGSVFTVVAAVIAGALLPQLFALGYLQRRWPTRRDVGDTLFMACFYATNALCVEYFYRWQAVWFGVDATLPVLTKKVLVDQLVYTPVFSAPYAVACFAWWNSGYSFAAGRGLASVHAYVSRVVPTLMANWLVWFPAVAVIYSLPPLLQIPIFSLALSFWALMLAYIHARPEISA